MGYQEIMELPITVYGAYLKWGQVFILEQTEEGRDALYKTSAIHQTEPEFDRLRQLDGYQVKGVD